MLYNTGIRRCVNRFLSNVYYMKGSAAVLKKFVACLIFAVMLCFTFTAFAAPYSVDGNDCGDDSSVMAITNPIYSTVTLPCGDCVISGYSRYGSEISLYRLSSSGIYELCGTPSFVGASGIFFRTVTLYPGKNSFVIRAQLNGKYKQCKFDAICFGFNKNY